ncbi:PGF-pre-PGF domain-containing protein, partial [Candidatus Woesearchaeota archaeon]|nr:PGF-pre-PGF domain-containing protein [Candidatus Woesearchaeota archaeon]
SGYEECESDAGCDDDDAATKDVCQSCKCFHSVIPYCGNSIIEPENNETCDDGNNVNGDGCSSSCKITYQCNDLVDNDNDGKIDFQNDTGCTNATDNTEFLDLDEDLIDDYLDNCPGIANQNQKNFDNDSQGDACDNDDDNDGIADASDYLLGNSSDINTTMNITITSNNATIFFKEEDNMFVELNSSDLNESINTKELVVEKNSKGILISGIKLKDNKTKTVYIAKLPGYNTICIDDAEITTITQISSGCNQVNEYFITCDGTVQQGYSCNLTADNTTYKITGLKHSGVQQQCQDADGDGYGNYCAAGTDCADDDGTINPAASEVCRDGKDNDCDGSIDENCQSTTSSGGGGGGGGGGSSSGVQTSSESHDWYSIAGGKALTMNISSTKIPVTIISFTTNNDIAFMTMTVKTLKGEPDAVVKFEEDAYKYLEIANSAVEAISNIAMEFKVERAWIKEKGISQAEISIYRYNDGGWHELSATKTGSDENYAYYKANVPGFSYFAIGTTEIKSQPAPQVATPAESEMATDEENIVYVETIPPEDEKEEQTEAEQNEITGAVVSEIELTQTEKIRRAIIIVSSGILLWVSGIMLQHSARRTGKTAKRKSSKAH